MNILEKIFDLSISSAAKILICFFNSSETYTFNNPKIDTLNAAISSSGKLTFTPDKWDTTSYVHRVYIDDVWGFKDTLDIKMLVIDVNDPPILDLSSIPKLNFLEGANSDSINITRYASD